MPRDWVQIEQLDIADLSTFSLSGLRPVSHVSGSSGVGKWIFGISITVVGGAILLVIRAYLKGRGYDVP